MNTATQIPALPNNAPRSRVTAWKAWVATARRTGVSPVNPSWVSKGDLEVARAGAAAARFFFGMSDDSGNAWMAVARRINAEIV
jgi:hypothetical protein